MHTSNSSLLQVTTASSLKSLGTGLERGGRERERSGAHNQSPEPVSKCVSVCVRVGIAAICETFSVKIRTVPGKQGQLVNVNVHKRLCVSQVLFD